MSSNAGRKSRGERVGVGLRIPVELLEAIEQAREEAGASRTDWMWSALAQHHRLPHLDPLRPEDELRLDISAKAPRRSHKPTRAA